MTKLFKKKDIENVKNPVNRYEAKVLKVKSTIFQRIVKTLVWILIVFLLFKGTVNIVRGNQTGKLDEQFKEYTAGIDSKLKIEQEVADFAESFVMEYLTYKNRESEDHQRRIRSYVPSYIADGGMFNLTGQCQVLNAWTISREWYSHNQINIDIKAKVKYINTYKETVQNENAVGEAESKVLETIEEKITIVYLRVPVREIERKYVVEDLPVFIPEPDKAEIEYEKYYGVSVDEDIDKQIKETLTTFFKAYYEGESGAINYFMSDNTKKIKGLGGKFKFTELNEVMVYKGTSEGNYIAIVDLFIEDINSHQPIKQAFHIELEVKEARYFIKKFDTRIGNLKYKEE